MEKYPNCEVSSKDHKKLNERERERERERKRERERERGDSEKENLKKRRSQRDALCISWRT